MSHLMPRFTDLKSHLVALLLAATMLFANAGCALFAMSDEQLQQLGDEQAPKFKQQMGGPVDSPQINSYVTEVGERLAAVSEKPDVPWQFTVLDTNTINAFALPGGHVFITRGLLSQLKNEAELAGVLGHEIGHVTARHTGERLENALTAQFGIAILAIALGAHEDTADYAEISAFAAASVSQLALMAYGRDDEREADRLGVIYMTQLGYNPVGQIGVMKVLAAMSQGDRPPQFLQTHPYPEERIALLDTYITQNHPDYNVPGAYSFHAERFRENALKPLRQLPPPRGEQAGLWIPPEAIGVAVPTEDHAGCGGCHAH